MGIPKYFISCDWGTTNFRLRVVETKTLKVLAEHGSDQGIKVHYEEFLKQQKARQGEFFSRYLKEQIQKFPPEHQVHIVVATGMASANIGLYELPYADFPFTLNGDSLVWKNLSFENGLKVLLVSGVKSADGMMRGEEIQAVGLENQLRPFSKGTLLLPGTHSKHIAFDNDKFTRLQNFMTGELFEVLSKKSILVNSVMNGHWNNKRKDAFKEGLSLGFESGLSANLLRVRAKDVIDHSNKENNYFMLSGVLIGDELSYLKNSKYKVILAGPESVVDLYSLALTTILDRDRVTVLDAEILVNALFVGQRKILGQYGK